MIHSEVYSRDSTDIVFQQVIELFLADSVVSQYIKEKNIGTICYDNLILDDSIISKFGVKKFKPRTRKALIHKSKEIQLVFGSSKYAPQKYYTISFVQPFNDTNPSVRIFIRSDNNQVYHVIHDNWDKLPTMQSLGVKIVPINK